MDRVWCLRPTCELQPRAAAEDAERQARLLEAAEGAGLRTELLFDDGNVELAVDGPEAAVGRVLARLGEEGHSGGLRLDVATPEEAGRLVALAGEGFFEVVGWASGSERRKGSDGSEHVLRGRLGERARV